VRTLRDLNQSKVESSIAQGNFLPSRVSNFPTESVTRMAPAISGLEQLEKSAFATS
jgi:hypothetical protein